MLPITPAQGKKKINRGSGWKMNVVPLVAHAMAKSQGSSQSHVPGPDYAAVGEQVHAANEYIWPE